MKQADTQVAEVEAGSNSGGTKDDGITGESKTGESEERKVCMPEKFLAKVPDICISMKYAALLSWRRFLQQD